MVKDRLVRGKILGKDKAAETPGKTTSLDSFKLLEPLPGRRRFYSTG